MNSVRLWPLWVTLSAAAACYASIGLWSGRMQSGFPLALTYSTTAITAILIALWLLFFSRVPARPKWAIVAVTLSVLGLLSGLVKIRGFTGNLTPILESRWFGGDPRVELHGGPVDLTTPSDHDVRGFLGPGRAPVYSGVLLDPDWASHPPRLIWRRPIGEGFSSFAVVGDFAVTQQQEGDQELVVCYQWRTGEPRWKHADKAYHSSTLGGVGPRATPAIDEGRVYALGATGILNCLDGRDGRSLWQRDVPLENLARTPTWGFSCSPLVVDRLVVVSAGLRMRPSPAARRPHLHADRLRQAHRRAGLAPPARTMRATARPPWPQSRESDKS